MLDSESYVIKVGGHKGEDYRFDSGFTITLAPWRTENEALELARLYRENIPNGPERVETPVLTSFV